MWKISAALGAILAIVMGSLILGLNFLREKSQGGPETSKRLPLVIGEDFSLGKVKPRPLTEEKIFGPAKDENQNQPVEDPGLTVSAPQKNIPPENIQNSIPKTDNLGVVGSGTFNQGVPPSAAILPPKKNILDLPEVAANELLIDQTGAKNFSEYMDQIITLSQNVSFSYQKFQLVSIEAGETILFAEDLIDRVIKENNFGKYKNSLLTMKEFSEYKAGALGGIKIFGDAIDINQKTIALEKLKIKLIDKALGVASGAISRTDFDDYYKKYNDTAFYYLDRFKGKDSGLIEKDRGVLYEAANALGLIKIARAFLPLPFGGLISVTLPCFCNFGLSITVGPPAPGKFFISGFGSRIFPFFKPLPPSWILGDYSAAPIPCLEPAYPVCVPIDATQGVVIIAGTSL